jgi:Heterokaryon incompatibility protein (HET)
MRLLQFSQHGELSLTKDLVSNIPPYAILSHTWGNDDDEVTFDDLANGLGKSKTGYTKLQFCGSQARKDKIEYFWVDTCCINKANHAELSEAVTSMFRWYRDAVKCYVYLPDVSTSAHDDSGENEQAWQSAFRISRWFTRGWTLQELLAPRSVQFFSQEEMLLGDKETLMELIHEITDIPVTALQGTPLAGFQVDERLRWAVKRDTKKKEDKAYCLLGIFNVFIPLIYGEEDHAFTRLKEEIDKRSGKMVAASPLPSSTVPFRRDVDFIDRRASQDGRTLLEQIEEQCGVPAARVALVGIGGAG